MTKRMPVLFLGHGNPMNALATNDYTRAWSAIGRAIPRPRAVLCISAHWYQPVRAVTATAQPFTIHDFGGFPAELYEVQYPAPGDPVLAEQVAGLLQSDGFGLDKVRGLDHGAWSVLMHVYPEADVPIIQLSIDGNQSSSWHYTLAKKLRPLRDDRVLIVGSGNLVHNLHVYAWGNADADTFDWAARFETLARDHLTRGEFVPLVEYDRLGPDALLAAPTPDHYLPLLYVLAQFAQNEPVTFPVEGFEGGSVSMLAVQVG
ncbi:MAG TPA: 4,5-DOPA dioxygenase extradiol [Woeseiaceae bacterium]|nr:4,5-DOPA dioxygenase extradiol [Woeseiaceae bacterium]